MLDGDDGMVGGGGGGGGAVEVGAGAAQTTDENMEQETEPTKVSEDNRKLYTL